jgi:hypothetical protein
MSARRLRQDDAIFAIRQCLGNLSDASERLGVSRQTLYTFAKTYPKVQEAIDEAREIVVDKAEKALVTCLEERQPWAIALVLKTLGKWRGYITPKDLTPAGQTRLPNAPNGETDEPWVDALRLPRRAWDEADDAGPDWEAREAALIEAFQAERQTLLARIEALEAAVRTRAPTLLEEPASHDVDRSGVDPSSTISTETIVAAKAEDEAVDVQLAELVAQLQRKLSQ